MELTLDDVTLTLSGRTVLSDAHVAFRPGRVTVIVGPNGAGKSSLVRAAAGLLSPATGHIRVGVDDLATLDPRARARLIGYLPQEASVHWNVPAREVVALGRLPHRSPFAAPAPEDRAAIDHVLALTDTTAFADRPVHTLSGGERARVLFARVLAGRPRWLIADEPLASLDPAHQFALLDLARRAADDGAGVVLVLHDLAHAARIADDVLILRDGRVVGFGPVEKVLTPDAVETVFGVSARRIDGALIIEGPLSR
ncbi:ABC transporter [Sphingomonas sp. EC-HK361]|uniref:ABC transporter ATP-binding protein n=1 Tax=Sphingomonas sp. EC-HK361 TaxID=2038397 RepID=UPI00125A6D2A|nr:ABC transporter ATP-binding protein [Sphingomonas sp. EC-HK361]VVT02354.1 ABC transporter [Sphingomonas sp. EC-HK361]